jgi:hypothetical protein
VATNRRNFIKLSAPPPAPSGLGAFPDFLVKRNRRARKPLNILILGGTVHGAGASGIRSSAATR